jgi:hypothetical protein
MDQDYYILSIPRLDQTNQQKTLIFYILSILKLNIENFWIKIAKKRLQKSPILAVFIRYLTFEIN